MLPTSNTNVCCKTRPMNSCEYRIKWRDHSRIKHKFSQPQKYTSETSNPSDSQKTMKNSVLLLILSITILTATVMQDVQAYKCGTLSTGKRINRCIKLAARDRVVRMLMSVTAKMEQEQRSHGEQKWNI